MHMIRHLEVTYTHDTSSRNWRHKLTPSFWRSFWYMYPANLGPDSSGTRFRHQLEHCSTPILFQARKWRARD